MGRLIKTKIKGLRRAALRKEVVVFIDSFSLKHYENPPKYVSIPVGLSFFNSKNSSIKTALHLKILIFLMHNKAKSTEILMDFEHF